MMLFREQLAVIEANQKHWPVLTIPIARKLGLRVYRMSGWPQDVSGLIRRDEDDGGKSGFAIYVNADHAETRRRFTIAHELGHFVLHRELIGDGIVEDALLRAQGLSNRVEAQANRFAADLLMPRHLLDAAHREGIVTIPELARAFKVSKDAMSIRLLGISWQRASDAGYDDARPVVETEHVAQHGRSAGAPEMGS